MFEAKKKEKIDPWDLGKGIILDPHTLAKKLLAAINALQAEPPMEPVGPDSMTGKMLKDIVDEIEGRK